MGAPRFALLTIGTCCGLAVQSAVAAPLLLPHRAVYDLSLDKATDRSGINGVSGRMVYEFAGSACEGYTVNFRFVTQIDTDEMSRITDQQTTTFEGGDGKTFDFVTKSFIDEALDTEVKGTATTGPEGTTVKLQKPEPKELDLKPTRFPTEHLLELIGKAKAGENFYETDLFDGSDEASEVMMTSVIVGKAESVEEDDPERSAMKKLADDKFWPVTIAYFDGEETEGEETPDYNISFKLHESGITRDLLMNYGEFSIKGRLVDLAMFETPKPCDKR